MGYEIERKFLVNGDFKSHAFSRSAIKQGYLSISAVSVIRVRTRDEKAWLTIKSAQVEGLIKRHEWEYEIPLAEAEEMLLLCEDGMIDKTRYLVQAGRHLFEVDEFHGENEGLLIAEVELESEEETFEKPDWLGPEVTGDERYYNSFISMQPYKWWSDQ
jgi:CYTH domain-containing protein